ncbi:MAG: NAD(P)/FAD-dependent oxidoreductase [Pirellulaceae bacterium]|nr:NAD(P)/FAD-dependent oxidoreductase [Pirellulaceae bacterium]
MNERRAILIGGGPAGLTAAYELATRSDVRPIVLEASDMLGGIARTVNYKGNRIDIGGHRFFSKSDRVMQWWADMLPLQAGEGGQFEISYQGKSRPVERDAATGLDPATSDEVMLVRPRKSRIYFLRKFFDYPISLSKNTILNLGLARMMRIGFSYLAARLFPVRNEKSLEDFLINRFGRELYLTFFKSYTEKVWGVPCQEISAAWGAQRIKGLSISKAILNALQKPFRRRSVGQKGVETSLIEQFLYPKLGPGQMWETCARKVESLGGEIRLNTRVERLQIEGDRVVAVETVNTQTGERETITGDFFFSTMPIKELVRGLDCPVPAPVREISEGLIYRDFITVGLLLSDLKIHDQTPQGKKLLSDNWIYIQEPEVQVGRLQIFNNWSPYLVADPGKVWVGLEYFCQDTDELWKLPDAEMSALGVRELSAIGIIEPGAVLDSTVLRMPKTYPAYFGSYDRFDELRGWLDRFENLFLVGRNGMHRYNNQDHSMLTAMTAVDNILAGRTDKANIWDVNTEQEYHEAKDARQAKDASAPAAGEETPAETADQALASR